MIVRHYHVIDNQAGNSAGYRDDVFSSRSKAVATARARAEWSAATSSLRIVPLAGTGRFFISTGYPSDPGRTIEVEECNDAACMEAT